MDDLFGSEESLQQLPLIAADVSYLKRLELGVSPEEIKRQLIEQVPWKSEKVTVWGKSHAQPRLIAWFGDKDRSYAYSGVKLDPLPWTSLLQEVRSRVETCVGVTFNSVLLNYYRDENDSMGFHSDDEPQLGIRPIIASLSLGEPRRFVFKPKVGVLAKDYKLSLESGSLLLMKGDTQANWKHGIPKESRPCGARVNLTFRRTDRACREVDSAPAERGLL